MSDPFNNPFGIPIPKKDSANRYIDQKSTIQIYNPNKTYIY